MMVVYAIAGKIPARRPCSVAAYPSFNKFRMSGYPCDVSHPLILNLLKDGDGEWLGRPLPFIPPPVTMAAIRQGNRIGGIAVATFVFDTPRAVKALAAVGFPEAQAEALVEIVGAAVGENAATKADVDAAEQRTTARIEALEERMESRLVSLEQRITLRFLLILLPGLGLLFAALRYLPG